MIERAKGIIGAEPEPIMAGIVLFYSLGAAALSWRAYADLASFYMVTEAKILIVLLAPFLAVAALLRSPQSPGSYALRLLRDRLLGAGATVLLFSIGLAAFTTYKEYLTQYVPYFADGVLANVDRAIFWGHQPWHLFHTVVPVQFDGFLGICYEIVWFPEFFGMILVAAFLNDENLRRQYLAAFVAMMIILGTAMSRALASVGPILYDRVHGGTRFADLITTLHSTEAGRGVLEASDYLYNGFLSGDPTAGGGISAMPSMHVAVAVLNAIFIYRLNWVAGWLAWAFAAITVFGSVYFGWHYVLDAAVSLACVPIIWKASRSRKTTKADVASASYWN